MYDSQVPIDINCAKLIDWLVQRRHCNRDWGENLAIVRRKIRAALKDMPENEQIKELLTNSRIDYFKCKQIVDILKQTEADSKNIFGYYSSQRMKDWKDIVYQYEKNCIYIAEIATNLIREVNYEVPGVKRIINKFNKDREDVEKERVNLLKKSQQFTTEYNRLAQSYGIKGVNIHDEFRQESKSLILAMNEVVEKSKNLLGPLKYYREIASTISKMDGDKFLTVLYNIIDKGNTTVYELKYGEAPEKIEQALVEIATQTNASEIDFGDDEIDFGEDPPSSESSSGFVHVDKASSDNGNGSQSNGEDFIKLEKSCDKIARQDEAKLTLELRKTRNQFLNDLFELEAFFNQQLLSSPENPDKIHSILADIKQISNILNKERNKILFQINESPDFIEDIISKFSNIKKQVANCQAKAENLAAELKDLERQIKETEIHLKQSCLNAKKSQDKVESSLKGLYNGRPINIMGCVYYK